MPSPSEHALLSASSAERWLHCTRAPRLEEQLPESTSAYAEEGRLAHAIAELKLRKHLVEPMGPRKFAAALKKLKEDPLYQPEMDGYTDAYVEHINNIAIGFHVRPFVDVEARLDFSSIVPEGFGTGDCIMIGGDTLHIFDFKYGKGVAVEAEDNPQMRLYAVGALMVYGFLYNIQRVRTTIFQPRINNISDAEISREELLNWATFDVKPKAAIAFAGEGEFVPGDWCRFCRARAQCRARASCNLAAEEFKNSVPDLLSDDELGGVLTRAVALKKWAEDLEKYALAAVLQGRSITGWKAVEGRSNRQFANQDQAFEAVINAGYPKELLYDTVPKTLSNVEKLLGKATFTQLLSGMVVKPQGKPALAPESDSRPPFQSSTAAQDFAETVKSE